MSSNRKGYKMKSIMLFVFGLLVCVAGAFPLNPSFTPEAVAAYKAKADAGDAEAQCNLGWCYAYGEGVETNKVEAVKWYRKAAEQGDAFAQCMLGRCHEKGEGVKKDMVEAVKWYRKAAEQGDADAQRVLCWCYTTGEGVKKDMTEAVKWYRKAAERDNSEAQCLLGACFAKGAGVAKNMTEAVKWFRKAAEQGQRFAQINLGWCYAQGEGVEKDAVISGQWYLKAAKGNPFLAAFLSKQVYVFVSLLVLLVVFGVFLVIVATYLPCTIVRVLQSERSLAKRLFADLESVMCSLFAVACLFAYFDLLTKASYVSLEEFLLVDFLPLSVGLHIFPVDGLFFAYYGIRTFVERRRLRRSSTRPHVTFAQYVKACVVAEICAYGVVGLWLAFVLALLEYLVLSGVCVLGTIALMIYTWPTRKKYDKLVNGGKRSNHGEIHGHLSARRLGFLASLHRSG